MKLTDIWKTQDHPTVSFEFYPAKSAKSAVKLDKAVDKLAQLNPDFVSVTFGAGGSTREGSYQLVKKLKDEINLEVLAYFACYGLSPERITSVLDSYKNIGIENLLAVRGDEPRELEDFTPHPDSLPHASDLLAFITPKYDFCIGAAGYPEGHIQAESQDKDLEYLKLKVENGAQYIITNYFYDNQYFFDFVDKCRDIGIQVPILPGVMPIYSLKMMKILANLCGATISAEIQQAIAALPEGDKKALVKFGIEFALNQCRELLKHDVKGLHFYTMDRSSSTMGIVKSLKDEGLL